ncbi:hypothetical protein Q3G72_011349 [Acer saccharum]|nr:hypothetical protein Q3G72_011349 [Acer saccharum]
MTACVGDFGLARFVPEISFYNESSSLGVRGTVGYIAPEYGIGNKGHPSSTSIKVQHAKRSTKLIKDGSSSVDCET